MKLAAKLVVAFVLGIMLLTAVYGYLAVDREIHMWEDDMAKDAMWYCGALEQVVTTSQQSEGTATTQVVGSFEAFIDSINNRHHYDSSWRPLTAESRILDENADIRVVANSGERILYGYEWTDDTGAEYITYLYPVELPKSPPGEFLLTTSLSELNDYTSVTIYRTIGLMAGMALVGGLLMALLGVTQVGRPLEQLIAKTRKVASGDLSEPVVLRGFDELSELAESLNLMCIRLQESQDETRRQAQSRIEALEQLRHADRLKTVGRLAAGMAHELGTPLSVVAGRASLIASGKLPASDVEKSAETIKAESDRMAKTIRQLLDFARHSHPQRARADLRLVIRQTVDLLQPLAGKRDIRIEPQLPDAAAVAQFDVGQIQQVLTNLIVNAMQAMPDRGTIQVQLDRVHAAPPPFENSGMDNTPETMTEGAMNPGAIQAADYFRIQVVDNGSGICEEDLPQLFEPFFTTKSQGQGTGLGLSISYGIVREHGGWIDVQSTMGEGSTFAVYLPAETEEPTSP